VSYYQPYDKKTNLTILVAMTQVNYTFRKKLTRDDWVIIISNLIPVFGVWFLGWSAVEAFIVYALETLIIGILTVLKLFIATFYRKKDDWQNNGSTTKVSGLFFIFFFIMHFGIFAAVQTSIFAGTAGIIPQGKSPLYFFFNWWTYINKDIGYMLAGFIISYLARDFLPFLHRGDYKNVPMMLLIFQPYGRIIIQQFTVILGSMFLTFKLGVAFILVFALVKIFVEVYFNFESILRKTMESAPKKSG